MFPTSKSTSSTRTAPIDGNFSGYVNECESVSAFSTEPFILPRHFKSFSLSKPNTFISEENSTPPSPIRAQRYLVSRVSKILFNTCIYNDTMFKCASEESNTQLQWRISNTVRRGLQQLTTEAGMIVALIILDRIQAAQMGIPLTSSEFENLFSLSCVLATKWLEDGSRPGAKASRALSNGILQEELKILKIIRWHTYVSVEEYSNNA